MTKARLKRDIHLFGYTSALEGSWVEIIREEDGTLIVYDPRTDWQFEVDLDDLEEKTDDD